MEIAILVFFIAIFGGVLFLLALAWFIFRRLRKSRSAAASRNFSGGSNYGGVPGSDNSIESDDDSAAIYAGGSLLADQEPENPVLTETAQDSANQSDNKYSHESRGASAAPAESSYMESSYSGYESSSSYDSGSSSSDSSSSSSDGGSSSSSSSD